MLCSLPRLRGRVGEGVDARITPAHDEDRAATAFLSLSPCGRGCPSRFRAFSGEVGTGSPQKMRPLKGNSNEAPPQTDELYEHSRWCMWTPVEPAGTALIIRARSSMGPRTRGRPEPAMSVARSAAEVLRDHVVLEVEAIDRMYLNVYVPHLQSVGAVVGYLRVHRGQRFASTTAVTPMTEAFVRNIDRFVNDEGVDLVTFQKGQRKDDVTQKYVRKFTRREGVLYVGKAQEKARVMRTERRCSRFTGGTYPWIVESTAMVNHYYFYCVDEDFGPFFLKFCSYFPHNAKLCINGNEYLKRQLAKRGVALNSDAKCNARPH